MRVVYLLNSISVGLFGMILSAAFCDILWTRPKRRILMGSLAVLLMFQGVVYFFIDSSMVENLYPIITHIPLIIILAILNKKWLWPVISVLTAYLFCQIRRWLALLITAVLSGDLLIQNIAELVLTLPLLLFFLRFVAPLVRSVSRSTTSTQCQFGLVPLMYYGFDYLTRVYTDLLLEGALVALEFMPFVCCLSYLEYVLYTSSAERMRSRMEHTQANLNMQITQAVREIESLRESQRKAGTYRHDLRHHMQYLSACIDDGKPELAQAYIREVCSEVEANKVTAFCENEATNLIFASFARQAEKYGIPMQIKAAIPQNIHITESDFCVLVSNALENAIHSCRKLKQNGLSGIIDVSAYEKRGKIFLQIINSCDGNITFAKGVPVTDNPGHGIGVQSICAIVEKYGGIYTFSVEDDKFILRVSL